MYRVTLNGAHCIQQTWDNALNVDGWADEVFFTWSVANRTPATNAPSRGRSAVYGDTNMHPDRIKAGDATPNGGIRNQNFFPIRLGLPPGAPPNFPPIFPLPPWSDKAQDGFPILLWQGNVGPNDLVAITPLIWEWDGANVNPKPAIDVANDIAMAICAAVAAVNPAVGIIGGIVGSVVSMVANQLGIAGDRPIGANLEDPASAQNTSWPELSFNGASVAGAATVDNGYGPGIYRFVQKDPATIGGGEYAFYVQIAKV